MEFYAKIKAKIKAIEKSITTGDDSELQSINRFFAENSKPLNFDYGSLENAVLKTDKHFETLCALLEGNGVSNATELTVTAFYSRLEYFKKVNSNPNKIKS